MAYNTQELLAKAIKIIPEKNLFFFEDVYTFLGISVSTFYEHFPKDSKGYKQIADLLNQNAVRTKHSMRNKWYKSENATLQVALMKLIGNDEDRQKLTKSHHELTGKDGESLFSTPKLVMEIVDTNETEPETTPNS